MPTLMVMRDGVVVRIARLPEGECRVGRSPCNHLVLHSQAASRSHATLTRRGHFVTVRDLHSTNGTFLNNERVTLAALLPGDTVHIAEFDILYLPREMSSASNLPEPAASSTSNDEATEAETEMQSLPPPRPGFDARGNRIGGPHGAHWDGNGVAFSLVDRGREISALITADALQFKFGAFLHASDGSDRAVAAYEENHVAINVAAWTRYESSRHEPVTVRIIDL